MVEVSYDEDRLLIGDESLSLERAINDIVITDERVVALLRPPPKTETVSDRNIVAFDLEGTQRWKIDPPKNEATGKPYIHVRYKDGQLTANNWNGYKYIVSLEDGSVSKLKRVYK